VRQLILGTAGHIDHGKTALVRALTGVDTDRLPEEKRRGITIDLGFADLTIADDIHVGIVDVPGHENFIRNMLAGATGIDLGLLVVAADEGVMPQTREHLAILELLGVRDVVIAMTKADLAQPEWRDLVADDIAGLLAGGPFAGTTAIAVSATTGEGLDLLRDHLVEHARLIRSRPADDLMRLPIDRVFSIRGTGTVVTGTLWSGTVARDHKVRLMPADRRIRVRAVQTHGRERDAATAGERTALALVGVDRLDLRRGDVLVDAPGWQSTRIITARLRVLESAPSIRHGQRVRFHLATAEVAARIVPAAGPALEPGSVDIAQLRLEKPIIARAGDRFVVRSWSPVTTIAGGLILEPAARRRKRVGRATAQRLNAILDDDPAASVEAAVALAGWTGLHLQQLPVATPLPPAIAESVLRQRHAPVARVDGRLFHDELVSIAGQKIIGCLRDFHRASPLAPGLALQQARQILPAAGTARIARTSGNAGGSSSSGASGASGASGTSGSSGAGGTAGSALADHVIARLGQDHVIRVDAGLIRLADHQPRLTRAQQTACNAILATLDAAGVAATAATELPPDLAARTDLEDLLHHLTRTGDLVPLTPDRYVTAAHAAAAATRVRSDLGGRSDLGPGDFRDIFGISRKYLLPLLAWLDRTGITVRTGELRSVPRVETPPQAGPA